MSAAFELVDTFRLVSAVLLGLGCSELFRLELVMPRAVDEGRCPSMLLLFDPLFLLGGGGGGIPPEGP